MGDRAQLFAKKANGWTLSPIGRTNFVRKGEISAAKERQTTDMAETSRHNSNFFRIRAIRLGDALQLPGEQGVSNGYIAERCDCNARPKNCVVEKELLV